MVDGTNLVLPSSSMALIWPPETSLLYARPTCVTSKCGLEWAWDSIFERAMR